MLKSATVLLSGNLVLAAANFLRFVLLARLLGIENFAIATTFSIFFSVLTMPIGEGLGQMLIQAPDGDKPRVQAALQGLQLALGVCVGALFFVLAGPFSWLMKMPEATGGYQVVAGFAVLIGLLHFDIFRQQREHRFGSWSLFTSVPVLVSVLAVFPAFWLWGDWRVMPAVLLVQSIASLTLSQICADRSYALAYDREIFLRGLKFSLPLMGNAALLFAVFNGDRIAVANLFDREILAWFSAAFALTLLPVNMIIRNLQSLLMPGLAKNQAVPDRFDEIALVTGQAFAFFGAVFAVAFAVFGQTLMLLLFGPDYGAAGQILVLLAVMQAVRCLRASATVVAIARAQTKFVFYITLLRAVGIAVGAGLVFGMGWGVQELVLIGILFECLTFPLSYLMMRHNYGFDFMRLCKTSLCAMMAIASVVVLQFALAPVWLAPWLPIDIWTLVPLVFLMLAILPMQSLRREFVQRIKRNC